MSSTFPQCLSRLSTAILLTLMLLICQEISVPSSSLTKRVNRTSEIVGIPDGVQPVGLFDFWQK